MLWILLAALAQPSPNALDAWRQRVAEKSSAPQVQGAGDIDGDGLDEHWLIVGCEGVLFIDEGRWLWVFGHGGQLRPGPSAPTSPQVHCSTWDGTSEATYALDNGVPYRLHSRSAGRHGLYSESHRAERWTRGEWQHKAVWAYDTSPLTLGERTLTVERADDGAILRGFGPQLTLPALHAEELAATLQWVDGGVEVVIHDGPSPLSPGHDGLFLVDPTILQVDGAQLVVDPSPLYPPPPHAVGSATEPPGPWLERPERSAGKPRYSSLFESFRQLHPQADYLLAHSTEGRLKLSSDGTARVEAPPGVFLYQEGQWRLRRGELLRIEAYRDGQLRGTRQLTPVPPTPDQGGDDSPL